MKQALHIFQKDFRQLWLPITVVLLLATAHAVFDVWRSPLEIPETARVNQAATLLSTLVVLGWWYLIAVVIYEEPLPGDRQFWVTRPYSWKSLLGAKLLFVLALFNIPLLISDCCILGVQHFPILTNFPALLSRQIPLTLLIVLPSFVLATMTTGFAQFVLAWFLLALGLLGETFLLHPMDSFSIGISTTGGSGGEWVGFALPLAVAVGVVVWQYTKRRTSIARAASAICIFIVLPALAAIPITQKPTFIAYSDKTPQRVDPAKLKISYSGVSSSSCNNINSSPPGMVRIALPLQIDNLPPETALLGFAETHITAPPLNYPEHGARIYWEFQRKQNSYCQVINLPADQFERIQSQPVALRTTFHLTAITNRPTGRFPAQAKIMAIPNVGSCQAYLQFGRIPSLLCRAGVYSPDSTLVSIEYSGFHSEPVQIGNFHSDREAVGGLSPVEKWITYLGNPVNSPEQIRDALLHAGAELVFTPQRLLGYGIKNVEARNLNLAPYVSPR